VSEIEPMVRPSDEERAALRAPAQKALEEARTVGAGERAPEPFARGQEALDAAEKLLSEGKTEEARAEFGKAESLFVEARLAAQQALAENKEPLLESAQSEEAPAAEPPTTEALAPTPAEQAATTGTEAPAAAAPPAPPVVAVVEPTETVSEAPPPEETPPAATPVPEEPQGSPREDVLQAKLRAEAARDQATTRRTLQVAQTTLEAASKHMADAAEMEVSAPDDAKASYELAAELYGEAAKKTEAMTEAEEAAAKAKAAALEIRNQVTQEVRTLAQKEAVAGDTAWNAAEDADDAPEQAKALYELAQEEYAKALRVAAQRASEPEKTSAKAQERLAAAQARAQEAQSRITDEIRQYAQQQAAEADALFDLATQSAQHDPAKAAELFEQARGKYDDAAAAAQSAKRQEFVAKLREKGVVVSPDGAGGYATIGAAIGAVAPDTPIFIKPGVYKEAVVIDKPVALIGDGAVSEIRIESTNADCITIETSQAVVHGLTLRSSSSFDNRGVYTVYCAQGRLLIEYCDIATDSLSAVAVNGASTVPTIRGCNIHDSTQAGIFFYGGAQGIVENCEIAGNGLAGIQIKSGANPTVRQCKIRQSKGSGIFVNEGGAGIIESCDISQNALAGISIATAGNPTVRGCTIAKNRRYGVRAYEAGRGTVKDCAFSGNQPEDWFIGEDCEVTRINNKE